MFAQSEKSAGNQGNNQNFNQTLPAKKLWLVYIRMKQKKKICWKKTTSKWPILEKFSRNFLGLVPGLVVLNDVKVIDVAQPIWLWGCPT